MKELRPTVDKVEWRVAFAFDPEQKAILLTAAAKGGIKEDLFYKRLLAAADDRYDAHIARLKATESRKTNKSNKKRR